MHQGLQPGLQSQVLGMEEGNAIANVTSSEAGAAASLVGELWGFMGYF